LTPKKKNDAKEETMSQYNASFNLYYDVILQQLAAHFFETDITESDSKYGIAHYSIMRTLFDYVDLVVEDFRYTGEQLLALIDEHEKLKKKFEQKLLLLTEEELILNIESE